MEEPRRRRADGAMVNKEKKQDGIKEDTGFMKVEYCISTGMIRKEFGLCGEPNQITLTTLYPISSPSKSEVNKRTFIYRYSSKDGVGKVLNQR